MNNSNKEQFNIDTMLQDFQFIITLLNMLKKIDHNISINEFKREIFICIRKLQIINKLIKDKKCAINKIHNKIKDFNLYFVDVIEKQLEKYTKILFNKFEEIE